MRVNSFCPGAVGYTRCRYHICQAVLSPEIVISGFKSWLTRDINVKNCLCIKLEIMKQNKAQRLKNAHNAQTSKVEKMNIRPLSIPIVFFSDKGHIGASRLKQHTIYHEL